MEGAAPLFRDVMLAANALARSGHAGDAHFARPAGIVEREVCPLSGLLRGPHCPQARREEVALAHAPTTECAWHGANGLALPAEVSAWQPGATSLPAALGAARVEILGPANDARFVLDPVLPRSRQAVQLRVAVRAPGVETVRWEVDGALLAEVRAPFDASLPLVPGTHRIRAVLPDGTSDELAIHAVDGAHR
jgi:hypothetical protein